MSNSQGCLCIDGGVRRATDILKALCLGAKGVGIGRPFLFAMSTYGQAGVERAMQLLKDEMYGLQRVGFIYPQSPLVTDVAITDGSNNVRVLVA
jgi:hypothetical protein